MSESDGVKAEIKQVAGLTLKTQIHRFFARILMDTINFIKDKLKIAFYDKEYSVRKTVSSVMAMIIVRGGINIWPDLLQFLVENLKSTDVSVVENSIHSISIIVEDCSKLFEEENYYQLIQYMLPPIFGLINPL